MTENENNNDPSDQEEVVSTDETTIGSYLIEARERKNLSLKVISQNTKISTTLLGYLENNQLDLLPNKAYVIGFIKSYCKTVGADERLAIQCLDQTYILQSRIERPQLSSPFNAVQDEEGIPDSLIKAGLAIAGIALFFIIVLNLGSDGPDQAKKELAPVKPQILTASTPLQKISKVVPAKVEELKKTESLPEVIKPIVKATPEILIIVATPEPIVEVKKVEPKLKKKNITFKPMIAPLFSFKKNAQEEVEKYLPAQYRGSVSGSQQKVFINAVEGDTWITYKADNNDIKKFVLKKNRSVLIRGQEVRVFLGNIHAAKVFLNNQPLAINSPSGVKSLVFPEKSKKKYMLPLFIYKDNGKVVSSDVYMKEIKASKSDLN